MSLNMLNIYIKNRVSERNFKRKYNELTPTDEQIIKNRVLTLLKKKCQIYNDLLTDFFTHYLMNTKI